MRSRGHGAWVGMGAVLLSASSLVDAQEHDVQTQTFERLWGDHLPRYCLYTQLFPDQNPGKYPHPLSKGKYTRLYKEAWRHMHHYCFGMDYAYRALIADDDEERKAMLLASLDEYDYVLDRSSDAFILKPEVYTKKGSSLVSLGRYGEAAESYLEAVRLQPDYVPAYLGLSGCFEFLGDRAQALAMIEAGLQEVPDSEPLLARRAELASQARAGGDED